MYGIETKVGGVWKAVNPPGGPPPYCFETEEEAETLARVLYPELMRAKAAGGEELIRIATDGVRAAGVIGRTKPTRAELERERAEDREAAGEYDPEDSPCIEPRQP